MVNSCKVVGQEIWVKDISDHAHVWIKTNGLDLGPKLFRVLVIGFSIKITKNV